MSQKENVAILGLGAMGAYFASRFLQTPGVTTTVAVDDSRFEQLHGNGITVNGERLFPSLTRPDAKTDPADLIIVALKHQHLLEALPQLKNLVGEHTTIISVMNGLDSEEIIASVYGKDKILYAISVGIDAVRENGVVNYSNPGKHIFGDANNTHISERVKSVQNLFDRAGIHYETPVDMIRMLWWKFMINVGMNQSSAVMRAPYGAFQNSPEAQELMKTLMLEVINLAIAAGIALSEKDLQAWYPVLHSLSPQGKTSMLQDIEAGRKTEVEIFGQKVLELSETYAIATPVNRTMVQIIRVMDQRSQDLKL
jgi:2-dehydropantoate 2-reductase